MRQARAVRQARAEKAGHLTDGAQGGLKARAVRQARAEKAGHLTDGAQGGPRDAGREPTRLAGQYDRCESRLDRPAG